MPNGLRVNINDSVLVKLNAKGLAIHREDYEGMELLKSAFPYRAPKADEEGYSRWQLWSLMQLYGPHIHLGGEVPFETEIIIAERGNPAYEIRPGSQDMRAKNHVVAEKIADKVISELMDRSGLRQTWDAFDEDICDEIRSSLIVSVKETLNLNYL